MSRHCLYCAKELPKSSTNNFCSKECWTEYKKLKAMDVGTDKQATVLLKRSELAEANELNKAPEQSADLLGSSPSSDPNIESTPEPVAPAPPVRSSDGVFEDVSPSKPSPFSPAPPPQRSSTETSSISERVTNIEILLNEKLGQGGDAQGLLDDITRKIDDLTQRQSKLEGAMEKADAFLRTVDKFEDRIRRIEREIQTLKTNTGPSKPQGFFARLFS